MKQLLNKPLRAFAGYAFLILLCSIPAYYYFMDYIWISELNEHNRIIAEKTRYNLNAIANQDSTLAQTIGLWNKLQPNTDLQPTQTIQPDSIYNLYKQKPHAPNQDIDRFQGLVTYFSIQGQPFRFRVETNVEESYETILTITGVTLVFFIFLVLGFILINKRISARLWQPFYATLQKLRAFSLDKQQSITFDPANIAEFEELNQALSSLIESNLGVYKQQKEFTENASHELQTPIAIVQSKLDLLLQNQNLTQEQSSYIDEANQALARVSRINKNLLLLSKLENVQYARQESINLSELLSDTVLLFADYAEGKNIAINTILEPAVSTMGNKVLVEILLANLILNAIKHNLNHGTIQINLSSNRLVIANLGTTALLFDQLFRRFGRASTQTPSTGLGLAIVKEIATKHNWTISYEFQDNWHYFSVILTP